MYLAIDKNGARGTSDPSDPHIELQVVSIGSDMFAIWGSKAALYVAVDPTNGKIYTTSDEGRQCVFMESLMPDFYNIYESYRSVYDGTPQCFELNEENRLEMGEPGAIPGLMGNLYGSFIMMINDTLQVAEVSQSIFTCSKLKIETLE